MIALIITISGFLAMTIYAFTTTTDITVYWAVLFGASIALLVLCIICIFVKCKPLFIFLCFFAVVLGLFYVAYDT
jgi:FtsH-binding integral membrane protein